MINKSEIKVFNTDVEVGMRVLVTLSENKKGMDLQRIVYYDYFLLHLHDVFEEQISLHPSNPYHATEIAVRRELIQEGIKLMSLKGLIDVKYVTDGIHYSKNKMTDEFLQYFESSYFIKLRTNAKFVAEKFRKFSDKKLQKFVYSNIGKWSGEFERESLFRGGDYE